MKSRNQVLFGSVFAVLPLLAAAAFLSPACKGKDKPEPAKEAAKEAAADPAPSAAPLSYEAVGIAKLPSGLKWVSSHDEPFASPQAKKGGTFTEYVLSFPLTLRTVGPDSNGAFRYYFTEEQSPTYAKMGLLEQHPNTGKFYSCIATEWAEGKDGKTVYYKLDPDARWSDGKPVTADDFIYTLEFHRSKEIVAPWYNNWYTENFKEIVKYDDHTIAVALNARKPDLVYYSLLGPTPRHFYGKLAKDHVQKYNWVAEPNVGPYDIAEINKGKSIVFKRKKDWWAKDKKFFKNRYNPDKVVVKVIRDVNVAFEHFRKGKLDTFSLTLPEHWHDKSNISEVENGYVQKLWLYTDTERPNYGMFLNMSQEIFKDKNARYAFAHAMNIDKVIASVLRGDYERLESYCTGFREYSNKSIKARRYDLQEVDRYMKLAGWDQRGPDGIRVKDGKRFSVRVTYGQPHHEPRLVVLKEEAKKAGIELNLQLLDSAASFKSFLEKKHEVAWMGWSTAFRPQYWEGWHSDNAHKTQTNNITDTADPEMDKLIDRFRDSFDGDERAELSRQIIAKIHEIGAFVPRVMVPYMRSASWRWVKFPENLTKKVDYAYEYGLFWIDEDAKKETETAMKKGLKFPKTVIVNKHWRVK